MLHMTGLWWLQKRPAQRDARALAAQLTALLWSGLAPQEGAGAEDVNARTRTQTETA